MVEKKCNLFYDGERISERMMNLKPIVVRKTVIGEGKTKICVPIVEKSEDAIVKAAKEICETSADLVEWRADWYESVFDIEKVQTVIKELRNILGDIPLLFTFRTKNEGGEQEISLSKYIELLRGVAGISGVDMVDVEVFFDVKVLSIVPELQKAGLKVVGSNHDFEKTPNKDELVRRLCYMQEIGVDIPKIAVMPREASDVLTLLSATEEMMSKYADRPFVTISMSGMGAVSRIAGEFFGSAITFGATAKASAPGQIYVEDLCKMLEVLHQDRRM